MADWIQIEDFYFDDSNDIAEVTRLKHTVRLDDIIAISTCVTRNKIMQVDPSIPRLVVKICCRVGPNVEDLSRTHEQWNELLGIIPLGKIA